MYWTQSCAIWCCESLIVCGRCLLLSNDEDEISTSLFVSESQRVVARMEIPADNCVSFRRRGWNSRYDDGGETGIEADLWSVVCRKEAECQAGNHHNNSSVCFISTREKDTFRDGKGYHQKTERARLAGGFRANWYNKL